jgi:hypothetical protein
VEGISTKGGAVFKFVTTPREDARYQLALTCLSQLGNLKCRHTDVLLQKNKNLQMLGCRNVFMRIHVLAQTLLRGGLTRVIRQTFLSL